MRVCTNFAHKTKKAKELNLGLVVLTEESIRI